MTKPEKTGLRRGLTHYGDPDFALYLRRSFARAMGYGEAMLARPVIGITDTASGFNNCHRSVPELIEATKRGVLAAGGLPLVFPVISLGEPFLHPTSLMFRNLMSMDVEEMIRAQPMDAVVLVGGCDKTVPALLMGALSADKPAILVVTGPMMTSRHGAERLGACTDCRRFWAQYRAGTIDEAEIRAIETRLATTAGTCMVMGTASTMACLAETLGMTLPGTAAIPAVHADRLRAAEASGMRAVALAKDGPRPSEIVTPAAIDNALRVLLAIGGSTNGVLHLAAIAGRAGIALDLERLNALSEATPVLVDLKPTGPHYMEDLFHAGGLGAALRELKPLLRLEAGNVAGQSLEERLAGEPGYVDRSVVRSLDQPVSAVGGLVALFGTLAPGGAILKRSAADARLFEHEGRAVVFESLEDLSARIDDPDLDVTPGRRPGAAERRAEERHRHARGRLSADPGQARARRREGHDPDLGRAHERHRVRHDRPARHPGSRDRRPARAGAKRRSHPPQRRRTPSRSPGPRGRAGPASVVRAAAAPRARARLRQALPRPRPARRIRAATSIF